MKKYKTTSLDFGICFVRGPFENFSVQNMWPFSTFYVELFVLTQVHRHTFTRTRTLYPFTRFFSLSLSLSLSFSLLLANRACILASFPHSLAFLFTVPCPSPPHTRALPHLLASLSSFTSLVCADVCTQEIVFTVFLHFPALGMHAFIQQVFGS